jgi:hypothetical protein
MCLGYSVDGVVVGDVGDSAGVVVGEVSVAAAVEAGAWTVWDVSALFVELLVVASFSWLFDVFEKVKDEFDLYVGVG